MVTETFEEEVAQPQSRDRAPRRFVLGRRSVDCRCDHDLRSDVGDVDRVAESVSDLVGRVMVRDALGNPVGQSPVARDEAAEFAVMHPEDVDLGLHRRAFALQSGVGQPRHRSGVRNRARTSLPTSCSSAAVTDSAGTGCCAIAMMTSAASDEATECLQRSPSDRPYSGRARLNDGPMQVAIANETTGPTPTRTMASLMVPMGIRVALAAELATCSRRPVSDWSSAMTCSTSLKAQ